VVKQEGWRYGTYYWPQGLFNALWMRGVKILNAIQDVYLENKIDIA